MKTLNNSIAESYCNFEVSKLLKEKGFECETLTRYQDSEIVGGALFNHNSKEEQSSWGVELISRPTHALAIEWIRVNFNVWCYTYFESEFWHYSIIRLPSKEDIIFSKNGDCEDRDLWVRGDRVISDEYTHEYNSPQEANEEVLSFVLTNLI